MANVYDAYPELIFIDATYKLLDLRIPLYLILVEDSLGLSEQDGNPAHTNLKVVMADKRLKRETCTEELFY